MKDVVTVKTWSIIISARGLLTKQVTSSNLCFRETVLAVLQANSKTEVEAGRQDRRLFQIPDERF